nr:transposase, mutator type [Tanacetum cinerariifolium]
GHPKLVSFEIHHGQCFTPILGRSYVGGHVSYVDVVDIDEFCLHDLKEIMVKLGYGVTDLTYCHFLRPKLSLDYDLHLLTVNVDMLELEKYVKDNKIILVNEKLSKQHPASVDKGPTIKEIDPFDDLDEVLDTQNDLRLVDVEVDEHDLDVIDYDSFGSDLDDGIDHERRN